MWNRLMPVGFVLMFVLTACKGQQIDGQWANQIAIDGNIDDWAELRATFFEDQGAAVALANDSTALYIQLRVRDPQFVRTIGMTGLTIWLDPGGSDNRSIGVRYFGPAWADSLARELRPGNLPGQPMQDQQNKMLLRESDFMFIDRKNIIETFIASDGSNGPRAAFDTSWGFFCYEFSIPFGDSRARQYALPIVIGTSLGIGAEWGGMSEPGERSKPAGARPPGIGGGGFPGGGPGDGMGGRRPGGSGRAGPGGELPEKQEVWFKMDLVSGPRANIE